MIRTVCNFNSKIDPFKLKIIEGNERKRELIVTVFAKKEKKTNRIRLKVKQN